MFGPEPEALVSVMKVSATGSHNSLGDQFTRHRRDATTSYASTHADVGSLKLVNRPDASMLGKTGNSRPNDELDIRGR